MELAGLKPLILPADPPLPLDNFGVAPNSLMVLAHELSEMRDMASWARWVAP